MQPISIIKLLSAITCIASVFIKSFSKIGAFVREKGGSLNTIPDLARISVEKELLTPDVVAVGAQRSNGTDDDDVGLDHHFLPIRDRWTWFDAKTDVLFVHQWFYNIFPSSALPRSRPTSSHRYYGDIGTSQFFNLRDFCRDVRTICIDTRSLVWRPLPVPNVFAFNLLDRNLWPALETYLFCGDVVYLHLPGKVIRTLEIFADDKQTALVSIDDFDELRRLKVLHDAYCRPWANEYFHHGPPLMEKLVQPPLSRQYAEEQLEKLQNIWLHAYYSALPNDAPELRKSAVFKTEPRPNPNHPCFNHEHPWAREALQKMPDYKLVVAFQLCMARHIETKVRDPARLMILHYGKFL